MPARVQAQMLCSRGDPRLKWREIRLDKASDLGHCICLDGHPDFGLNDEGYPHCLARVPRGRGGYRFARSRAGLISAHFEYKDREFAAHEFEVSKAHGRANLQAFWVFWRAHTSVCCERGLMLLSISSLVLGSQQVILQLQALVSNTHINSWVHYLTKTVSFPSARYMQS